jgi:MFS family permease
MNILKRNHHLLILGFAESVSGVGNWITALAIYALIVFRGSGDVLESSGVLLAGLGPMLLCSPLAGWLCDRFDRKRLMIASEVL